MKTTYGVIGCGHRPRGLAKLLSEYGEDIRLKGGFDPDEKMVNKLLDSGCSPDRKIYHSYEELAADPEIDWVLVASPNHLHKDHVIAAFENKKNVFCEKPLATTIADCVAINQAHARSGKRFATGFVLRYSKLYEKAKAIIESGTIGKIVSVDANENIAPAHGAYIMTNWRNKMAFSGSHVLEKCCHDLDLLNWLIDSLPVRVAAFGGRNMFIKENAGLRRLKDGKAFIPWFSDADPFITDADIEDNVVSIMEYANQVRVQFQATMSNAIPERRMFFSGTEGNLIIELYAGLLTYKRVDWEKTEVVDFSGGDGHAGGDTYIMKALADSMQNGDEPACGGKEGLYSAVAGIAITEARLEGRVVDLMPTWKKLGVY